MGWTCTAEASEALTKILERHSSRGCYVSGGHEFFIDVCRKEAPDGAVTGNVLRVTATYKDGSMSAVKVGAFRIDPDGKLSKGPKHLRALLA